MPSAVAVDRAEAIYFEDLPSLDLEGLANWLAQDLRPGSDEDGERRAVYSDALYDLARLLEEVRFETALAAVYLFDLEQELFADPNPNDLGRTLGIPGEVLALLAPYAAPNPSPAELFMNPATEIPGHRILGGWHAGQLLDSALIRALAALDRLAILLWCAAGHPLGRDNSGDFRLPAFRQNWMQQMDSDYHRESAWGDLRALVDHKFLKLVKPYRDGFVHRRRRPMQLHGEYLTDSDATKTGFTTKALDPDQHLAIILGFYSEILRPAAAKTNELLSGEPERA